MWHLQEVEGLLRRIDELDAQQLGAALTAYEVTAPETKNGISAPFNFNLMFRTSIGPKGDLTGFLRPETAQGIFVNFKCALERPTFLQLTLKAAVPWQSMRRLTVVRSFGSTSSFYTGA